MSLGNTGSVRGVLPLVVALLLGACSSAPDPQLGNFIADQSRQLGDAAEMLDANSIALAPGATANDRTRP